MIMVSGSDQHGTPITLRAEKEGVSPQEVVDRFQALFLESWDRMGISFDLFTTTGTDNHREVVQDIFLKLLAKDYIYKGEMMLPHCESCGRYLPDRYVEGTCPHCGNAGARGDQCDNCGKPLNPTDLLDLRCRVCGSAPEIKRSEHYFLKLSAFQEPAHRVGGEAGPLAAQRPELHPADAQGRAARQGHHPGHRLGDPDSPAGRRRQTDLRVVRGGYRVPVGEHRVGEE